MWPGVRTFRWRASGAILPGASAPDRRRRRNALEDPRTLANPLVAGAMGLRFYAAVPLVTHDGHRLGTMDIIDSFPGSWMRPACRIYEFAGLVMDQMELRLSARKIIAALSRAVRGAERSAELERLVTVCAWSKKIQVDGEWVTFEEFLVDNLGVRITHGIDPEAARKFHRA